MYHIQELVSDDIVAMEVRHQHLFSQIRGSKLLIRLVSFWLIHFIERKLLPAEVIPNSITFFCKICLKIKYIKQYIVLQ